MESYSDWREENNLEEMHGGTMSKLGPREKGRKDKGKKKPQAIRQAKARTKALKQKLNTEELFMNETKELVFDEGCCRAIHLLRRRRRKVVMVATKPSNPRVDTNS